MSGRGSSGGRGGRGGYQGRGAGGGYQGGRGGQPQQGQGRGGGGYQGRGQQQPVYPAGRGQPQPQPGYSAGRGQPQPPVAVVTPQPQPPVAVPVVGAAQQENVLSKNFDNLSVSESSTSNAAPPPASSKAAARLPRRPGFGKEGRTMRIKANHFLVAIKADNDLTHYDVSITPEVLSKKVSREIITELVRSFGASHLGSRRLAYDGRKSVYTAGELPFQSKDFVVKLASEGSRREREFKVSIKFAAKCDLHHLQQFLNGSQPDAPMETIQCLDVVFRQTPSINYVPVGRSFFHPGLGVTGTLGNGLEYWQGFYQSLRPTQMGLSLNIDMSARGFYESTQVHDYVQKFLARDLSRPMNEPERRNVKRVLKGVRIEVNHGKNMRRHKITGLSNEPLQRLTFPVDASGEMISVVDYFRKTYNIVLRYPHLPAIQTGSDTKPTYLPMEVCTIVPGQRYTKKLNERQVTALLKATCQRPPLRESSIKKMVDTNDYYSDVIVHEEFGIRVTPDLVSFNARVLQPPRVQYRRDAPVQPQVGQWSMNNKKFLDGGNVDAWTCVSFGRMDYVRFCKELINTCCAKGMTFNPAPLVDPFEGNRYQIEKDLDFISEEAKKLGKVLKLLIVILPETPGSYDLIKRVCETRLGIVTQCCLPKQASKFSRQYMENVALKINVKVGGTNSRLERACTPSGYNYLCDKPTIVIGADVTHPSPGEDSSPSIAAVVASMDWPEVTKYRALLSAQGHRDEIIQDLFNSTEDPVKGKTYGGMIRDHLRAFYNSKHIKPMRIIFYRDGVSEGQFSQVLLHEVDAIRKACSSIEVGYMPRITFIVVQKRHHTRLFADDYKDNGTIDRSMNILPGTVVDTNICHPTEFDFYLCSHAGIQGTSRPAHYHVLFDENNFTADAIQQLTNNLCYTYARCTRSVSIVPPAYYAHLAAARARCYLPERNFQSDTESTATATRNRAAGAPRLPEILPNVKEVMFYC